MRIKLEIGNQILIKKRWDDDLGPGWVAKEDSYNDTENMDDLVGKIHTITGMDNYPQILDGNNVSWAINDDDEYIHLIKTTLKIKFNPKKYITNGNT